MASIVMAVSVRLIHAISEIATTKLSSWTATMGAKARNIWTERMSEFEREMISPVCTRS